MGGAKRYPSSIFNKDDGFRFALPILNACVGEISVAPFYAVKIGRKPIPGLFAVGNDAASIFGGSYPGAGATLGPAMTFGYLSGAKISRKAAKQISENSFTPYRVKLTTS